VQQTKFVPRKGMVWACCCATFELKLGALKLQVEIENKLQRASVFLLLAWLEFDLFSPCAVNPRSSIP
jgi:hypothetical protein